ncbi:MAG: winged helix-turn-helix transcriptional regulator [Ktedonobacteraceae bacterium]|nr:winged helix-turn-helix transcriptional regulator [Ktedonobacteraceae bacterium]
MAEHSYHQYCPVAHALDLVGDRWTLLIIRDLLIGPKRFVDLQTGLPGLGTNILTARLKWLEQNGVIARRFLPPPAASTVYELTPYGLKLEESLTALAHWGAESLGSLQPDQIIEPDAVMMALYGLFKSSRELEGSAIYEIHCEDERFPRVFSVRVHEKSVEVTQGGATAPDVVIRLHVETLYALSGQQMSLQEALAHDKVSLEGSAQATTSLINLLDQHTHAI